MSYWPIARKSSTGAALRLTREKCACYKARAIDLPLTYPTNSKGDVMNKSELIDEIAAQAEISKAAAGKALDATIAAVTNALQAGDTVTLVGFGTFYVGQREERSGHNPRTGEAIMIKAAKQPKFRAGKSLKDAVQ
ncbi:HU family DNA-binding protein [Chitinimonas lacunae]|uniref:HU family DNA-binding protein n=1 Tax=Chitinimonas lacunae TaxID=1963018 RepID=A0ABV8MNU6_9NEIS